MSVRREREEFVPRCAKCGYNLTGLTENRCPECGTPFDPDALKGAAPKKGPSSDRLLAELLLLPLLFTIPMFCCGFIVMASTSPGFFAFLLGVLLLMLTYNGERVRDKISDDANLDGFGSFVARSSLATLVILQLVWLSLFWGPAFYLLIKNPPSLIPF